MSDTLLKNWKDFSDAIDASRRKLLAELTRLHEEMSKITTELEKRCAAASERDWERGRSDALRALFENDAASVLLDPLNRYSRSRIRDRVPGAFEDFRTNLTDAARKLPLHAEITPSGLIETLPPGSTHPFSLGLFVWRDKPRQVDPRPSVLRRLDVEAIGIGRLEGRVYLNFAQATVGLLDPWQSVRVRALIRLKGDAVSGDDGRKAHLDWKRKAELRQENLDQTLADLERALAGLERRLVGATLHPASGRRFRGIHRKRRLKWENYWGRQQRSVHALVEVERSLVQLGAKAVVTAEEGIRSVKDERGAVTEELVAAIGSLERWQPGSLNPVPPGSAQLTSAVEKIRQWRSALGDRVRMLMPAEIESMEPRRPLPGWLVPWRSITPQRGFLDAIETASDRLAITLDDVEADHKLILREVERAREVVAYGIQTSIDDTDSGDSLARESVGNAISLVQHAKDTLNDRLTAVEAAFVEATASSFYQYHLAFEQGRLSLVSYLAREGAARGARRFARISADLARRAALFLWRRLRDGYHALLVKIGWEAPSEKIVAAVERWPSLDVASEADLESLRLPLIYERLFRPEPVQDLRFLVGREAEMAALTDARTAWEGGRFSAVLVVGQRGSGKTSLLNCALSRSFADAEVVRGKITERVVTEEGLRAFLAELVQVPAERLSSFLSAGHRVIVIEELERTFLRKVGGFTALDELLNIVSRNARSNLWVLSLAAEAYPVLDAAVGVGRHFSHRINASSVDSEDVREAILQRHNLSGLRLEFSQPPKANHLWAWLDRTTGIRVDPEISFFDAVYRQSGGVFRSAFDLWRRHINRAEGGVLYMRFPEFENQGEVTSGLTQEELFSLQMILQHGSLTQGEHAEIFGLDVETSSATIEHLLGRGIVELEPTAPGFRVRPPALLHVRAALSAENLI